MKLPIGQSDFRDLIENQFIFVDKSLLIKDIIDDTQVILITRPRRFGKTLNLSMLHYFFAKEIGGKANRDWFKNLKITTAGVHYLEHQCQYPVISLTFKDIKNENYHAAYDKLSELIIKLFDERSELRNSKHLSPNQKNLYDIILQREANQAQFENSLRLLIDCLYAHHGVKPIVLIDEYDTPIQTAYMQGYYDSMVAFMRNFLGAALKDNPYVHKAVLTGILRVSKESLFSDLNNIKVYSLFHTRYSEYFGFTEPEVDMLLQQTSLKKIRDDVRQWYNGYQFGDSVVYNPWSIINCIVEQGKLQPYWINTGGHDLIKMLLIKSKSSFKAAFEMLLQGKSIEEFIDERLAFQYLSNNESAAFYLLLAAGYLKVVSSKQHTDGLWCRLQIPNQEVRGLFQNIIEQWLSDGHGLKWYYKFLEDLLQGNMNEFSRYLQDIYQQIVSSHDVAHYPEAFYHGVMLGLTASLHAEYEIRSNRESGLGRYDLIMIPKDPKKLGIIMEFKISKETHLEETAKLALKQIEEKQYANELTSRNIQKILKIGIAFHGKQLHIAHLLTS